MRYIYWKNHRGLIRNFIFFIMGIYVGIILSLYFHGNQLDQLMKENNQLIVDLKSCKYENDMLTKEKNKRTYQLIRTIKFNFTEELEPFHETELLKALVEETHFIIGKKVEDVSKSPEFIYKLLNNKTFKAKDKNFEIKVHIIYIHSTTEIWLSAKEKKT